ncbi:MAG: tetratricopeptide repeat protein [Deltaproteobacteria bacterium]|nr:tetratricopeptide repeat protein [Deltaproteobacteria bacterium]MBW2447398.1 tetratricopeptide repeat protein [Deltaproteobacteria bacterium]
MAASTLSLRKRLAFAFVAIASCFLFVELLLAVAGFSARTDRTDPYVGFGATLPLFVLDPEDPERRVTAPNKRRWFNAQSFAVRKPNATRRIFCLGGSTTYGRPYDDRTSFCGWLRAFLPEADPDGAYEVVNAGGISYASYRVARVLEEVAGYEPDLVVLYTGHNEFLEDRTYANLRDRPAWLSAADESLSRTRSYSLLHRVLLARGGSGPGSARLSREVSTLLDQSIGPDAYHRDDAQHARILEHFRFNLERMVGLARGTGAEIVFVVPASNLRGCTPFKSEPLATLSAQGREQADSRARRAESLAATERVEDAIQALEAALEVDPRRADWLHRLGELRLATGRHAAAEAAFIAARDEDVCPLRAPTEFQQVVRSVAERRQVATVDLPSRLQAWGGGIPGEEAFLDHVHPTAEVHGRLADEILQALDAQGWLRLASGWSTENALEIQRATVAGMDRRAHGKALRNLAKVLAWAGKDGEAARAAERALAIEPEDSESLFVLGTVAQNQGEDALALARYERALDLDPDYVSARHNLGVVLARLGRWGEAVEAYRATLALDAEHPSARFNLARSLVRLGLDDEAELEYRRVLDAQPEDADAWFNLGRLYERNGRSREAQRAFARVLEIEPQATDAEAALANLRSTGSQPRVP